MTKHDKDDETLQRRTKHYKEGEKTKKVKNNKEGEK